MRTFVPLLSALLLSPAAIAGDVYKCASPQGDTYYSDTPCSGQAKPLKVPKTDFGGPKWSAEINLRQTACQTSQFGHGQATGYIHNATADTKKVSLTVTFTKEGKVMDTLTLPYSVPAFGRTPYSVTGPATYPDRCEYQTAWD